MTSYPEEIVVQQAMNHRQLVRIDSLAAAGRTG